MKCPRCEGYVCFQRQCFRADAHLRCLICGWYHDVVRVQMPMPKDKFARVSVCTSEQLAHKARLNRESRLRRKMRRGHV